jgi:hypothetical protein
VSNHFYFVLFSVLSLYCMIIGKLKNKNQFQPILNYFDQ